MVLHILIHMCQLHLSWRWLQTTCPSPLWVRIPTGTLDSFMWGSYPASLRNVGGSTQVPVRAWKNARKGTWGLPPPVTPERRDMTFTVSMWRKTQNKQTKNICHGFFFKMSCTTQSLINDTFCRCFPLK
jgi:hypothetical protein